MYLYQQGVSIHAPTWGATFTLLRGRKCSCVSIHAPTWGATVVLFLALSYLLFQSTHPRGVRLVINVLGINIVSFNPRTHVGCDNRQPHQISMMQCFNPRTHVGCDGNRQLFFSLSVCFNPRTHVGCDFCLARWLNSHIVSIHAPTWGATIVKAWQIRSNRFQSTHPRGVRLRFLQILHLPQGFNPRTHVGCDTID